MPLLLPRLLLVHLLLPRLLLAPRLPPLLLLPLRPLPLLPLPLRLLLLLRPPPRRSNFLPPTGKKASLRAGFFLFCDALNLAPVETGILGRNTYPLWRAIQRSAERIPCQFRRIVLRRKVGRDHMTQFGPIDAFKQTAGCIIVHVPLSTGDPPLQRLGITPARQHVTIMIALQHEGITSIEHGNHMARNMSGIRKHTKANGTIAQHKLDRFPRIVRHRVGLHGEIAKVEGLVAIEQSNTDFGSTVPRCGTGSDCHQDLPIETTATRIGATNVVGMLVGNQDGMNIGDPDAEPFKPSFGFARSESCVDQDTGTTGLNQQAVSPATTAERRKAHLAISIARARDPESALTSRSGRLHLRV